MQCLRQVHGRDGARQLRKVAEVQLQHKRLALLPGVDPAEQIRRVPPPRPQGSLGGVLVRLRVEHDGSAGKVLLRIQIEREQIVEDVVQSLHLGGKHVVQAPASAH